MTVAIPKTTYSNTPIREITLTGKGKDLTIGGESAYNFYTFEGEMPNRPRIAFEINDVAPEEWAPSLNEIFGDVYADPAAWAKKCVEFGAELIHLELVGTDPNGANLGTDHAIDVVKKVSDAVDVPLTVWGCGNSDKDSEVLRAVAEGITDRKLLIGPVVEGNYKQLGAGVLAYGHKAIASTPIDINLAKQLNILLGNLGVSDDSILIDPTVGGLGYGMEYSYSVMERARQAALTQKDDKLQYPMYCNLGREVWKTKEAKQTSEEAPELGDATKRGYLMEAITATAVLTAGADVLVLRHPETAKLVNKLLDQLM